MIIQLATEDGRHSIKRLVPSPDNLLRFRRFRGGQRSGGDLAAQVRPRRRHLVELLHTGARMQQEPLEFAQQEQLLPIRDVARLFQNVGLSDHVPPRPVEQIYFAGQHSAHGKRVMGRERGELVR